ncbi:MAG: DNA mismatch repair endonuclease MutL [Rickettsiales bacterium]
MTIRILAATTINRIAAGEVIERPAAVVRELLDNAIDAGATQIDIEIDAGGKRRIAVRDNGHGIPRDELLLAIQRHATSKLPDENLDHIHYLGFRGEALPSIGAVARLSITSCASGAPDAWIQKVEGGLVAELQPAPRHQGTIVEVNDLFYATPARLKFLKSDQTEMQTCLEIVKRQAIASPNIGFRVITDGKQKLFYPREEGDFFDTRLKRISAVMGRDFGENALKVDAVRDAIKVFGYASVPTFNRGTSSYQYLYVNQRPVRDRLLLGVVRAAYQDFLGHDRHPVVVVFLDMPSAEVDVNVHPAKAEVRFRDQQHIRGTLISALRHTLSEAGHRASTTVANSALQAMQPQRVANYPSYVSYPAQQNFALAVRDNVVPMFTSPVEGFSEPPDLQVPAPEPMEHLPLGQAKAQMHRTYVIAETADGVVIVDQHAAHERLVYEGMKAQMKESGIARQTLLIPEVIELGDDAGLLVEKIPAFADMGLIMEPFGHGAVVVREIPALLGKVDIASLVRDLVDDLREHGEALSLNAQFEHICGTMACHASVRAGRVLSVAEMDTLLRQMEATPHSGQCNHGRPTYVELKLKDIERLFGRT